MPSVIATSDAYAKALLHCHKYPTQAVLGVLVGKRVNGSDCYVTDAYPLFHSIPMGAPHPVLEVAYAHCQAAAKAGGLSLLGVYLANERLDDHAISKELTRPVLEFFASRLGLTRGGGSKDRLLVWFADNESMSCPPSGLSFTSFYYEPGLFEGSAMSGNGASSGGGGVPRPSACDGGAKAPLTSLSFGQWNSDTLAVEATVSTESVIDAATNALEAFAQYRLVDLEDHLENPALNYLEQPLKSLAVRK